MRPYTRVFLAEIEDVETPPEKIKNWTTRPSNIEEYYSIFWSKKEYPDEVLRPDEAGLAEGTLFAGKVKLLREIDPDTKKFIKHF
jgi:hypothetical protein